MRPILNPDAYLQMADTEQRHWWFSGRRAILSSVIETLKLPTNSKILEIGSGTGGNLQMLAAYGKVSALEMDATARSIAAARTGGRFDIRSGFCPTNIPFAGEKFDLICLFDVLEHIEDDVGTLTVLHEFLAEGGKIVLTVPAYRWLWSAHDEFLHHKRRYSSDELRRKIAAAGLQAERVSYFNVILFPLVVMVRLTGKLFRAASSSGNRVPSAVINNFLAFLFSRERNILRKMNLPYGVSILAVLHSGRP